MQIIGQNKQTGVGWLWPRSWWSFILSRNELFSFMIWLVVSHIFHFHAYEYLRKWSNFIDIFQKGWNHHLVIGDARNSLDAEIMSKSLLSKLPRLSWIHIHLPIVQCFFFGVFWGGYWCLVPEKTHKTGIFGDIFHILPLLIPMVQCFWNLFRSDARFWRWSDRKTLRSDFVSILISLNLGSTKIVTGFFYNSFGKSWGISEKTSAAFAEVPLLSPTRDSRLLCDLGIPQDVWMLNLSAGALEPSTLWAFWAGKMCEGPWKRGPAHILQRRWEDFEDCHFKFD